MKRTYLLYSICSLILGCILTLGVEHIVNAGKSESDSDARNYDSKTNVNYQIKRDKNTYRFISPIISVDETNESERYHQVKEAIDNYLVKEKEKGLTSAAVYFKKFSNSEWFSINNQERYDPGSLLKVGVFITYIRMMEKEPDLLNKEVVYHGQKGFTFPVEHYQADTVVEGHKYKINDMLYYMIKYSDNRATVFLEDHMDTVIFKNEFKELGITEPRFSDPNFTLNVAEYSMMFKALYNAGYLRKKASEDALALLSESVFKEGLLKGIPSTVTVAHKYGEYGNRISHELHESGIVYLNNNPYLLTVMTRGTDWNELSEVIGHISKMVYDHEVTSLPN